MADPTMSHASDPSSRPSPSEPDVARPAHDRELPVTPVDGDGAQRDEQHVAPEEQADGSAQSEPGEGSAVQAAPAQGTLTEDQVKIALRRVKDPELNLNILDLGLVYEIRVNGNAVEIDLDLDEKALSYVLSRGQSWMIQLLLEEFGSARNYFRTNLNGEGSSFFQFPEFRRPNVRKPCF